jgi:hypothetical protein
MGVANAVKQVGERPRLPCSAKRANPIDEHLRGRALVQEPIHRQRAISDVDVRDFWKKI